MGVVYTSNFKVVMPQVEIKEDKPEYVYVPLRGYCAVMAVYSIEDVCIGWIKSAVLGYESVKAWMQATNWRDQGY